MGRDRNTNGPKETLEEHVAAVDRHMSGPYPWYQAEDGARLALADDEPMLAGPWRLACVWRGTDGTYLGVFMMTPTIPSFHTGEGLIAPVASTEGAMRLLEHEYDLVLGKPDGQAVRQQ